MAGAQKAVTPGEAVGPYTGKPGRPMEYGLEVVIRAMACIVVKGLSLKATAEALETIALPGENSPAAGTIENWSKKGYLLDGVNWMDARKIVECLNSVQATNKYVRKEAMDYAKWGEATAADLEYLQEAIMNRVVNDPDSLRPSDLPNIVKARQLVHQTTAERQQESARQLGIVGELVRYSAQYVINAHRTSEVQKAMELFISKLGEEFARFQQTGVLDPDNFEVRNAGPAYVSIPRGPGRPGETDL